MGHTRTPKYELQIQHSNRQFVLGVDTLKEAQKELEYEYLNKYRPGKAFLWENKTHGKLIKTFDY